MIDALLHHFSALEDPRCAGKVEHQLLDIVVIAVCAVIACAESFEDMAFLGRHNLTAWLVSQGARDATLSAETAQRINPVVRSALERSGDAGDIDELAHALALLDKGCDPAEAMM